MTKSQRQPKKPLREKEDYYWDGGFMVFTQDYLKKRGYCCKSGCRHCPYEPPSQAALVEREKVKP